MSSLEPRFARRLDLTSLQLFVAVCAHGSMGRAAQSEGIATSAVSKRVAELELAVSTALLQRHHRGVTPTAAGERLLHHARSLLQGLDRLQGELQEYAQGVRGHVRVHANISAIVQFLPEDLGRFAREHRQIKIDLQEHLSGAVLDAIAEARADLGVCSLSPGSLPQGLQSRPYRSDALVLVMPKSHALAARSAIKFEDFQDCDIVGLHAGSSISLAMHAAAEAAGRSLRQRIQVTSLDAMCRMIDNGLGLGLLPARAFALLQGLGDLAAVALDEPWAQRQLCLLARDFSALSPAARLLSDHLQAHASASP